MTSKNAAITIPYAMPEAASENPLRLSAKYMNKRIIVRTFAPTAAAEASTSVKLMYGHRKGAKRNINPDDNSTDKVNDSLLIIVGSIPKKRTSNKSEDPKQTQTLRE